MIGKPSEVTPVSAWMLGELAAQIGFPPGVLNIVQGLGSAVGKALVEHPGIKAISFTGSTAVGRGIATSCASALKKSSLELGGKNPTLIFADAPREGLLDTVLRSAFQNSGQICLCGSRLLIERTYYEEFRDAFVARCKQLRIGDPQDPATNMGPVITSGYPPW